MVTLCDNPAPTAAAEQLPYRCSPSQHHHVPSSPCGYAVLIPTRLHPPTAAAAPELVSQIEASPAPEIVSQVAAAPAPATELVSQVAAAPAPELVAQIEATPDIDMVAEPAEASAAVEGLDIPAMPAINADTNVKVCISCGAGVGYRCW